MSQTTNRKQLTELEIKRIFETLGLLNQDERNKFISMNQKTESEQSRQNRFEIRISNISETLSSEESRDAELERPSG